MTLEHLRESCIDVRTTPTGEREMIRPTKPNGFGGNFGGCWKQDICTDAQLAYCLTLIDHQEARNIGVKVNSTHEGRSSAVPYEEPWTCWHRRDRTMGIGIGEKIARERAVVGERVSEKY